MCQILPLTSRLVQANFESGLMNPMQKNEQVNYWPSNVDHTDEVWL